MTTWMDLTIRPGDDPEIGANPETGEFEFSWLLPDGGRLTVLVSRATVETVTEEARGLLMLMPVMP